MEESTAVSQIPNMKKRRNNASKSTRIVRKRRVTEDEFKILYIFRVKANLNPFWF